MVARRVRAFALVVSTVTSLLTAACGRPAESAPPADGAGLAAPLPADVPALTDATPTSANAPAAVIDDGPDAEGLRLYREQYCGLCHAFAAAGTAGIFGPPHDAIRLVAEQRIHDEKYTGTATTAAGYIRESLRNPAAYRVPGFEFTRYLMPAYTNLSDAEVDALVTMLLDLGDGGPR